jgi:hypothetical protein
MSIVGVPSSDIDSFEFFDPTVSAPYKYYKKTVFNPGQN